MNEQAITKWTDEQAASVRDKCMAVLPDAVGPDRFWGVCFEMTHNPKLAPRVAACTVRSKALAVYACARLGLMPGDELGHVYLIPYKQHLTVIPGYMGYVELFHRQPNFRALHAEVWYSNDHFKVQLGSRPKIDHVPWYVAGHEDPGEPRGAYAVATLAGGVSQQVVMPARDVRAIKGNVWAVKQGKETPWTTSWQTEAEMWKKTAIRRLRKTLPIDPEGRTALAAALETAHDRGRTQAEVIAYPDDQHRDEGEGTFGFSGVEPDPEFLDAELEARAKQ